MYSLDYGIKKPIRQRTLNFNEQVGALPFSLYFVTLSPIWVEAQSLSGDTHSVSLYWGLYISFLKAFKIEPPYDLTIPLLDIYSKEMKIGYQRDISAATCSLQHYTQ